MTSPHREDTGSSATSSSSGATRVAAIVIVVALVGVGSFIGVRVKQALAKQESIAKQRDATRASMEKRPPSNAVHPQSATWKPHVDVTGSLRPWREADIGFELQGRLVKLNVATGAKVRENELIAVLDASRAMSEVNQAQASSRASAANLALAEDSLKRTEALAASKSISEAQAEQARQQVALARAQLEGAEATARLAQTGAGLHSIIAPFAGIVTKAPTSAGGVVQPGAPLVHIEDDSRFRLSASVGEDDAPLVKIGAHAVVTYRDRSVSGTVVVMVPSLDQATRRAPIEVEVPNDPSNPLLAWSFVHARIEGGDAIAILRVPPSARRPGSQDEVVKIVNGTAKIERVLHTIDDDGTWIVRQGLGADDVLLDLPDPDVKDGDAIELAAENKPNSLADVKR